MMNPSDYISYGALVVAGLAALGSIGAYRKANHIAEKQLSLQERLTDGAEQQVALSEQLTEIEAERARKEEVAAKTAKLRAKKIFHDTSKLNFPITTEIIELRNDGQAPARKVVITIQSHTPRSGSQPWEGKLGIIGPGSARQVPREHTWGDPPWTVTADWEDDNGTHPPFETDLS